ncbi:GMC oxidoreductase [Photobacterium frigidiphilum]|uniref:GMC oxidoreductase n=1 Tax=Photobacterium frigidiphilum TaxID=264736 RepID=UPI003D0C4FD1
MSQFDFDNIVVGSGFGGAVSALRLTEKGYRVLVLEKGKRYEAQDFAKSNWRINKFLWIPWLGLRGPLQVAFTRKLSVVYSAGVGGGSLVYGNTHLVPDDKVFNSPLWSDIHDDWQLRLKPYYALAQRMIGLQQNVWEGEADKTLKQVAQELGCGDTYTTVYSGLLYPEGHDVFGSEPNESTLGADRGDPYFNGEGPKRNSCNYCGNCMVGCRNNAKNTLDKNYLYFAERNGAEIRAESKVTRIEPIANDAGLQDGSAGYVITVEEGMGLIGRKKYTITTYGLTLSAGVLGSIPLLLKMRDVDKTLPNISTELGRQVMTNSETLLTVNDRHDRMPSVDQSLGTAITSMIHPDDETKIQVVRYGATNDASWITVPNIPLTSKHAGIPRVVTMLGNMVRHPITTLRVMNPVGKAKRGVWLLVMQTAHSYIHLEMRKPWYYLFLKNTWVPTQYADDEKLRSYFPIAQKVAEMYCKITGGDAANLLPEVVAGTPLTAHMMGGARIGNSAENAVIDDSGEVFGYQNLRVLDGSIIPGNLGVNPSLTILALTEHAMALLPVFNEERANVITPVVFAPALTRNPSAYQGEGVLHQQAVQDSNMG